MHDEPGEEGFAVFADVVVHSGNKPECVRDEVDLFGAISAEVEAVVPCVCDFAPEIARVAQIPVFHGSEPLAPLAQAVDDEHVVHFVACRLV